MGTKVVYSPGYGGGLSTDNPEIDPADPQLVAYIEARDINGAGLYLSKLHPGIYLGGLTTAMVKEVPEGCLYQIQEYDGSERVVVFDEKDWRRA